MTSKNTKTKFAIDIRRESKRLARDKAARWLSGHKDDTPFVNAKAKRKQRRRELYQQVRIHKRNAAISRWRSLRDDALQAPAATSAAAVAVPAVWPGAAMSCGLGVWQRRLLAALEERPTASLVDVLPRPYARSQYVALHRAAWWLHGKGKVDIYHSQRKGHMWVCRPQSD